MKKVLVGLAAALLLSGSAMAQEGPDAAWVRLSKVQSMIEYFFMETGTYPLSLEEMEQTFNARAPRGMKPIALPLDPATNKPFKYVMDPSGRKYSLGVPDPSKYGGSRIAVGAMDWGFLSDLADLRRYQEVVRQCGQLMTILAEQCELFAKDHQGQYPAAFDDLLPKYIKRHLTDPMTGKNFGYKKLVDGYLISCPNPEKYGLKTFQYNSHAGLQAEQNPARGAAPPPASNTTAPPPAPAPANGTH